MSFYTLIEDQILVGSMVSSLEVRSMFICLQMCREQFPLCTSVNVIDINSHIICELNAFQHEQFVAKAGALHYQLHP